MIKSKKIRQFILLLTMMSFISPFCGLAAPVQKKMEISKVIYTTKSGMAKSMMIGASTGGGSNKDFPWGKIEVDYSSVMEWADDVQIRVYVLLFNKNQDKKAQQMQASPFTMLTGQVVYSNVPQGRDNKAMFFIHPYALKRYGDIKQIHVELAHRGLVQSKMDQDLSSTREKKEWDLREWWTRVPPLSGQILNHTQTPFLFDSDNPLTLIKST
ncbi:MAG: hypothetical protein JW774_12605 [Candidatus Aureabacteria bacterium]|nr:hypothetical protein [Candidatus Auribacterota bacterium]